jgi:hypothetical protein
MKIPMAEKGDRRSWVMVNRAQVLTLWAGVVAEALGFEHDEALTLGRAVAGLNAYSKGVSLGLFQPTPSEVKEQRRKKRKEETVIIGLLHRAVPAKHTDEGLRALSGESPIHPESVQRYLASKFGDALEYALALDFVIFGDRFLFHTPWVGRRKDADGKHMSRQRRDQLS